MAILICFGKLPLTIVSSTGTITQTPLNADRARQQHSRASRLPAPSTSAPHGTGYLFCEGSVFLCYCNESKSARSNTAFIAVPRAKSSSDLNQPRDSESDLSKVSSAFHL